MITLGQMLPWCKFSDLVELPPPGMVPTVFIGFLRSGVVSNIKFRCAQLLLSPALSPFETPFWFRSIMQTQAEVPTIPESVCGAINLTAMASNET